MKTLQQCNWKQFRIEEIFDVKGTITTHPSVLVEKGKTPRITCAATNNGLDGFYYNEPTEHGNVLTVDSATIGFVSYQESAFIATDHVEKLVPKHKSFNRHIALFIKECIDKAKDNKFGYGYKFSQGRIKRQTIMLPSTPEGTPDYTFMEEYMRQKEQTILAKYKVHISNMLDNQSLIGGGKSSNVNWKEFYFTDVFTDIQRGKRLKRADHSNGKMPYVSSTALCNGVDGFVGNTESVNIFSNCITIANSGSVGSAFFHSYEFVASDHVTKLQNEEVSKYAYLFMLPIINRLAEKYSFNREINDKRIKRERFVLPATPEGTPDFAYMDAYMRNIELQQLLKYLQHLNVCL